jgi:thiol-disulfide isomerase/thioredoxin
MGALTVGPFSLSGGLLTTMLAIVAVIVVGNLVARARKVSVEPRLWIVIVVALVAARAAVVYLIADIYLATPTSILDIRDGGFSLVPGLLAGCAVAAWLGWRNKNMRKPVLSGAAAGVAVFAIAGAVAGLAPPAAVHLPARMLSEASGGNLPSGTLAGKPVVVNFWASWCGPCRREMPAMRQAQLDHPDITFVFVNQGESAETIRKYLAAHNLDLKNIVLDTGMGLSREFKAKGLPTSYFFKQDGLLRERRTGELSAATLSVELALIKAQAQAKR